MKVTIEDAGLGKEPIVFELDVVGVSIETHADYIDVTSEADHGFRAREKVGGDILISYRLSPEASASRS